MVDMQILSVIIITLLSIVGLWMFFYFIYLKRKGTRKESKVSLILIFVGIFLITLSSIGVFLQVEWLFSLALLGAIIFYVGFTMHTGWLPFIGFISPRTHLEKMEWEKQKYLRWILALAIILVTICAAIWLLYHQK